MAETFVPGGTTGGPGNVAGFASAGGNFQQQVTISPQGSDADPFRGSPTIAGGIRVGQTRLSPSSTLTRPANTTAYASNTLVASSATAGAIVVPSFAAAQANGGSGVVRRLRLRTSLATSAVDGVPFFVDLWTVAPTFNAGDGGIYGRDPSSGTAGLASGAASWVGSFTFSGLRALGDGSIAQAASDAGVDLSYVCAPASALLYWTLMTMSVFTPTSGQTFTLSADLVQD